MAVYVLGNQDRPDKGSRIADAIGGGIKDITQTLFTLQQLQDKRQYQAEALKAKSLGIALGYKQLESAEKSRQEAAAARLEDRRLAAERAQQHDLAAADSAKELARMKAGFNVDLAMTKAELNKERDAAKPKKAEGPPTLNPAAEAKAIAADLDRIDQGLPAEYLTGMSPEAARKFGKKRLTRLNAVSPMVSLMGGDMGGGVPMADASQGAVPATPTTRAGNAFKVVSP